MLQSSLWNKGVKPLNIVERLQKVFGDKQKVKHQFINELVAW